MLSQVPLFATPWTAPRQPSLSITISQNLLKLMFIESVMPSNRLNLCHPLLLLPSIFPSVRDFSNESVLSMWWPKYWSFSISPFNEYSSLICFWIERENYFLYFIEIYHLCFFFCEFLDHILCCLSFCICVFLFYNSLLFL